MTLRGYSDVNPPEDFLVPANNGCGGINTEVAVGQWEYQIFAKVAKNAGDQIWVSRYLAERTAEKYGLAIEWHPKPLGAPPKCFVKSSSIVFSSIIIYSIDILLIHSQTIERECHHLYLQ